MTVRKIAAAKASVPVAPGAAADRVELCFFTTFSRFSLRGKLKRLLVQKLWHSLSAGSSGAVSGCEVRPGCTTVYLAACYSKNDLFYLCRPDKPSPSLHLSVNVLFQLHVFRRLGFFNFKCCQSKRGMAPTSS